jgi:hypothetical protein
MFSSRKTVFTGKDVPSKWIFEHYLKLDQKLEGQDVKIKSVFNPLDKDPSLVVYVNRRYNDYYFRCFSTGVGGNGIELVKLVCGLSFSDAVRQIVSDYQQYLENGGLEQQIEYVPQEKWRIAQMSRRNWNKNDVDFWSPYNIGSRILEKYNVIPVSNYVLQRGDETRTLDKSMGKVYAYRTGESVYKIYEPMNSERKFTTFMNHLQGWDQIQGKDTLFICSSLKDAMSLDSLGIDADFIAPSSENANIEPIIEWIRDYPKKYVIFDNDSTGLRMMQRYEQQYGLPYIHLELSKDVSDSVRDHGARVVKSNIISQIQ